MRRGGVTNAVSRTKGFTATARGTLGHDPTALPRHYEREVQFRPNLKLPKGTATSRTNGRYGTRTCDLRYVKPAL